VSEEKHTHGPWIASKFGFQVLTGDSWTTICTLKDGAEWEDGRGNYEQEFAWQKQEANAVLIAAAPTLLKALQDCDGCVVAAEAEGLHEIISELRSESDNELVGRLIDLVERRLMWVREYAAPALAAALPAPPAEAKSEVGG
jgi:hypothetical protein